MRGKMYDYRFLLKRLLVETEATMGILMKCGDIDQVKRTIYQRWYRSDPPGSQARIEAKNLLKPFTEYKCPRCKNHLLLVDGALICFTSAMECGIMMEGHFNSKGEFIKKED